MREQQQARIDADAALRIAVVQGEATKTAMSQKTTSKSAKRRKRKGKKGKGKKTNSAVRGLGEEESKDIDDAPSVPKAQ
jgi:hypothetical protein